MIATVWMVEIMTVIMALLSKYERLIVFIDMIQMVLHDQSEWYDVADDNDNNYHQQSSS